MKYYSVTVRNLRGEICDRYVLAICDDEDIRSFGGPYDTHRRISKPTFDCSSPKSYSDKAATKESEA